MCRAADVHRVAGPGRDDGPEVGSIALVVDDVAVRPGSVEHGVRVDAVIVDGRHIGLAAHRVEALHDPGLGGSAGGH